MSTATELEDEICDLVDNLGSEKPFPKQKRRTSYPNSSLSVSVSSSISYTNDSVSSSLTQLTPSELTIIVTNIFENNESFLKFKSEIGLIQNEFVEQKICGEYLTTYTRPAFCKKLVNIKKGISAKIYKQLKSMSDFEIQQILNINAHNVGVGGSESSHSGESKTNSDGNDMKTQIRIPSDINHIAKLPKYCSPIGLINKKNIENYDKNEFITYSYLILTKNKYNKLDIDTLMNGLIKLELTAKAFTCTKRKDFCKSLKKYDILAAKAAKMYTLIQKSIQENIKFDNLKFSNNNNSKTLNCTEISLIAVTDFTVCAHKMIKSMNESMKLNNVSGKSMVQCYLKKHDLEKYVETNVRRRSAMYLTDMLWTDHKNDENKLFVINEYDRKKLLKYFISLYMSYIKNVIIEHKLDSHKCLSFKRKGLCKLFTEQCGLTIGVATNIVDTIYCKIE